MTRLVRPRRRRAGGRSCGARSTRRAGRPTARAWRRCRSAPPHRGLGVAATPVDRDGDGGGSAPVLPVSLSAGTGPADDKPPPDADAPVVGGVFSDAGASKDAAADADARPSV